MSVRFSPHHRRLLLVGTLFLAALVTTFKIAHKSHHHTQEVVTNPIALALQESSTVYGSRVRPLLLGRCGACHGAGRQDGGLRVDTLQGLLRGGHSGPAVVPRRSRESPLLSRGAAHGLAGRGPLLKDDEVSLLRRWIDHGAAGPAGERVPTADHHWAFQPLALPPVPAADPAFVRNPLDAFLAAGREKAGLTKHNGPADPRLLLRRLSIDLTGLPPTERDYQGFLDDPSDESYQRVVDRLLNSPRYAERWARQWMDVFRYSSFDGRLNVGRQSYKEITCGSQYIFRWRDYLIHAVQHDKPFNQVILEMLAGDELAPDDPEVLAGTGFLIRNFDLRDRDMWLTLIVDHTSQAFLGLTLGCARCHNHKFDPLTQKEYYQFRAFFEPHDVGVSHERQLAFAHDVDLLRPTYLYVRGNPKNPDKTKPITPQVPAVLGHIPPCKPVEMKVAEHKPGERRAAVTTARSSGRRLALAKWLVSDDNPLVARVLVNQIWQRHFGRGLVETPAEFGARSQPPSHPELLDWLAVEFRNHHWSQKWLHRLIVTSNTYRMSSGTRGMGAFLKRDPENRLYWRGPSKRMEAEVVRDGILHLAGCLDTTIGGRDEDFTAADTSCRRSLYLRASRADRVVFLDTFDAPRVEECYRRSESIVPQQGLALLNSEFAWRNAGHIAEKLSRGPNLIRRAFELIIARTPTAEEIALCRQFLKDQEEYLSSTGVPDPTWRARTYLVHSLLNHNDFLTIR
jgi:hypothetical protein